MKKIILLFLVANFSSCLKGPAGPAGPAGTDGINGLPKDSIIINMKLVSMFVNIHGFNYDWYSDLDGDSIEDTVSQRIVFSNTLMEFYNTSDKSVLSWDSLTDICCWTRPHVFLKTKFQPQGWSAYIENFNYTAITRKSTGSSTNFDVEMIEDFRYSSKPDSLSRAYHLLSKENTGVTRDWWGMGHSTGKGFFMSDRYPGDFINGTLKIFYW